MARGHNDDGGGVYAEAAKPERAASNIMTTTPENQAATFRNQDQVWPHRVIRRDGAVRALPQHDRPLADQAYAAGDGCWQSNCKRSPVWRVWVPKRGYS